jgi:4-amino-4-deoxy-L-arabinose transferase-like glycosyltransferase
MLKRRFLILLILLVAFTLRIYGLTEYPPGLTHDEANHGREAMGILDGIFLFYFPLNYGSEPLYSYTVAGTMWLLGQGLFSLRLVNVIFGLGAMALAYLWTAKAFDRSTALLAMALTAVSFWPVASSREALRAGMLPFFMVGAMIFFWQIFQTTHPFNLAPATLWRWSVVGFALCVAATLHIYLAARVAWLVFPLFLLYLALAHRERLRGAWLPTLVGLTLAGSLTVPMFIYLSNHPEASTRLDMLDRPLQELRSGNLEPVLANARHALLAFVWPGYGDKFLAYNIPGRPVFDRLSAMFFVVGFFITVWRWRQPQYALLLLWFGVGISPSLLTGATANTTRNLAAISAVYLFPAIGLLATADLFRAQAARLVRPIFAGLAIGWLLIVGVITINDYFNHWGESPAVRGAYQQTLVASLRYLEQAQATSPVILSSVYPGPVHDPSIRLVILPDPGFDLRWVDARMALLLPQSQEVRVIIPASTPPHPILAGFLDEIDSVSLRQDDLDPGFTVYRLDRARLDRWPLNQRVDFDGAVTLLHAHWASTSVLPGDKAELLTVWQVNDPGRVGPIVPSLDATDIVFFAQVLDQAGNVLTQYDSLDAPSWDWQSGDTIIHIHPMSVPIETEPGSYDTIVGIYDRLSGQRLNTVDTDGKIVDSRAFAVPLTVASP